MRSDARALAAASMCGHGPLLALAVATLCLPGARLQAQPRALTLGVVADGEAGAVTNPRFQRSAADSTSVVSRARVGGTLRRRSARGSIGATIDGETQRYRAAPDLSRFTYGASATADHRLTGRWQASGGVGVRTSLSRDVVTSAGLASLASTSSGDVSAGDVPAAANASTDVSGTPLPLLPLSLSHAYSAQLGSAYRASPRTTFTADVGTDQIRYDARALASGTSVRARLSYAHALTNASGVTAALDGRRTQTDGSTLRSESVLLGWAARLSAAVRVQLHAGAAASAAASGPTQYGPVGDGELDALALGGAWTVRYARDVSPALGVGAILAADRVGASYTRLVPGGWLLRGGVEQAWSRATLPGAAQIVTNASFADARRLLVGGLWAGLGAARRSRTQDPTVRSQNLSLTAGYVGSW